MSHLGSDNTAESRYVSRESPQIKEHGRTNIMFRDGDINSPIEQSTETESDEDEEIYYPIAFARRFIPFILFPRPLISAQSISIGLR
jgi:hypothetical protein